MNTELSTRRALGCGALLTALLASPVVFGQDKPRDPAAAEALYLSGRKLVNEGNWAEGCEKFRASMELNPAASTLINIANCDEHDGKLTLALVDLRRAVQLNQDTLGAERKKALEQAAKDAIARVEPRLGRVTMVVEPRLEGLKIARDGIALPVAAIGEEIPLDPGAHTFEAVAPGHRKEEQRVELKEGEAVKVELKLQPEAQSPREPPPPPPDKRPPPVKSGGVPAWAFVAGGAGLVAIGGSVFFRIDQSSAEARIKENCGESGECPQSGSYDPTEDNARKNRDFALFLGLGAVGVVGLGVAVFGIARGLSQKKAQTTSLIVTPYVGLGDGGLVARGVF